MSYSKDNLISELKRLHQAGHSTRQDFREYSIFPVDCWKPLFGTFTEFKRQAGLLESSSSIKFSNAVAKHSSLDTLRSMSEEKRNFSGRYLKPKTNRFQTVIIGSDIHDIECDPFWRTVFIDAVKRIQPEKIVLNGDIFDLPEFGKYTVDPREWDVVGRIKWVHQFLSDLRSASGNSELNMVEGNHEFRILRNLSESNPHLKSVLSDLHGFTIPKLLGLDKFEVNYIAPADLHTITRADEKAELRRNFLILYDCLLCHHFPEGKQFAMPGVNGHHHSHEVDTLFNPTFGAYEWHQIGGGHKREASYCNGEKWSNGFIIAHIDTVAKRVQFEYIDTTNDHVVLGGEWYFRDK